MQQIACCWITRIEKICLGPFLWMSRIAHFFMRIRQIGFKLLDTSNCGIGFPGVEEASKGRGVGGPPETKQ